MLFPVLKPKIIRLSFGFGKWTGMTIYPFVLLFKDVVHPAYLNHELVHIEQMEPYWKMAGPLGILAWLFLYFTWKPFRYKVELDAYTRGTGLNEQEAKDFIKENYKRNREV